MREIADLVAKVNPMPSRRDQWISAVLSAVIRAATMVYTLYLAEIFLESNLHDQKPDEKVDAGTYVIMALFACTMLFFAFRKVYKDRLVNYKTQLISLLSRGLKIAVTFLFWTVLFRAFPDWSKAEILVIFASYWIIWSGIDYRLAPPRALAPPRTPSS